MLDGQRRDIIVSGMKLHLVRFTECDKLRRRRERDFRFRDALLVTKKRLRPVLSRVWSHLSEGGQTRLGAAYD